LLRNEGDVAALLDLYRQVWTSPKPWGRRPFGRPDGRVLDEETNPLCALLKLSGAARAAGGVLQVRNRIYHQVFDREWITAHMPDAELRRQRAAYRRGVTRAATIGGLVTAVMACLALTAASLAHQAHEASEEAAY